MDANTPVLTYGQLFTLVAEFKRRFPQLDILDQPVTFSSLEAPGEYYNITHLVKEDDGHFTLQQL